MSRLTSKRKHQIIDDDDDDDDNWLEQMFTRPSRKSTFSSSFGQHHLMVTKNQFCFLFHVIFREQRPIESEPIESMMIATADD